MKTKLQPQPNTSPKILLFDVENAPTRGWVWNNYQDNLIKTDHDWYLLSFAYKWAHENSVKICALPDYSRYKRNKEDDRELCRDLWKVFDEADIVIAHNCDRFDVRKANARFLVHGMKPPSGYKTIDTLKVARRYFKFNSNKLNDLGAYLGLGEKLPHTGAHLWFGCMEGDIDSWELMKRYNIQDVRLLEKVYYRMRPWITNHPNLNLYTFSEGCPKCRSQHVQKRGFEMRLTTKRQRYQCQDCGGWFSAGPPIKKS
jgi:RNase_H superfamily